MGRRRRPFPGTAFAVAGIGLLIATLAAAPTASSAAPAPVVRSLDVASGITAGGTLITVVGQNFTHVKAVTFGGVKGVDMQVRSTSVLIITAPPHRAGVVSLQVVTSAGRSAATKASRFTYEPLSFNGTHLNGGWTAPQEIAIGNRLRAAHRGIQAAAAVPRSVSPSTAWSPTLGTVALARAKAWLGMPYSWDGGNTSGPSLGACDYGHGGGGWFDCRVTGFDCSGLTLYAWAPYRSLTHYAATQVTQAGSFHPTLDELQPGDLLFFSTNHTIPGVHHVVMYAGKGTVIQAFQSGFPVVISGLSTVLPTQYIGATRPLSHGKQGAAPSITHLSLNNVSPKGGAVLTITGRNLGTTTDVKFADKRVYQVRIISSRQVQVRIPAHGAGTVRVQVGNAWGVSRSSAAYALHYVNPKPKPAPTTTTRVTPTPSTTTPSPTPSTTAPTPTPSTTSPTPTPSPTATVGS